MCIHFMALLDVMLDNLPTCLCACIDAPDTGWRECDVPVREAKLAEYIPIEIAKLRYLINNALLETPCFSIAQEVNLETESFAFRLGYLDKIPKKHCWFAR